MNGQVREDETIGSLNQRLLTLEGCNTWHSWFGKSPGTVLSILTATLVSAFWLYHTWQVERIDKNHQSEITKMLSTNKEKINWLKDQQKIKVTSAKEQCTLENSRVSNKLSTCMEKDKKNITNKLTQTKNP